jgi:hypothetical protein
MPYNYASSCHMAHLALLRHRRDSYSINPIIVTLNLPVTVCEFTVACVAYFFHLNL